MSGKTLIGKDQLQTILSANTSVLQTAQKLLDLSRDDVGLREKIEPLVRALVDSGTNVNTAVSSVPGVRVGQRS